VQHYIDIGF